MPSKLKLLLLLCMIAVTTHAQNEPSPSLNIGDPAPPMLVREWIKGTPVQRFEKGKVYVLEFWATWCVPCKAAMPHLSALARQYKDRITFLGIDVMERKTTSMEKVKRFVDSMGHRMDYLVAAEDSNFMVAGWMQATGAQGIPSSFVVDAEGRLAWIGHPKDLAGVLPKIVNNTWNIKEALAKRISDKRLRELDLSTHYDLMDYWGKPDSTLLAINKIVRNEPGLKYAPFIASNTFNSLIKTNNLQKAYEYGKAVLVTPAYEDPAYDIIIGAVQYYSDNSNLPAEIYRLGAEAHQAFIDHHPYPELLDVQKRYNEMAGWYWRANDKLKAVEVMQKGMEALKSRESLFPTEIALFGFYLQQFKNR